MKPSPSNRILSVGCISNQLPLKWARIVRAFDTSVVESEPSRIRRFNAEMHSALVPHHVTKSASASSRDFMTADLGSLMSKGTIAQVSQNRKG